MKIAVNLIIVVIFTNVAFAQTPAAIEKELLGHLDNIGKYGNYGGSGDFDKVDRENSQLRQKLVRYGRYAEVLKYAFPKLKEKMFVTTSKDGRMRIYSWDEETGGTMHDYDSVIQYQGTSGKIYTWTNEPTDDVDIGGFYHQIFQVNTKAGPIYLAVSTFIGSTSLAGQAIKVVKIEGDKLDLNTRLIQTNSGLQNSIDFGYDFFSVVDRPERPIRLFSFDEAKRSFQFPIVIEDEKTPQGRVTNRFITYRFDGKYFVKIS